MSDRMSSRDLVTPSSKPCNSNATSTQFLCCGYHSMIQMANKKMPRNIGESKPSTLRAKRVNAELRARGEQLLVKTKNNEKRETSYQVSAQTRSGKRKLQEIEPQIPTISKSSKIVKSNSIKQPTPVQKSPRKPSKSSPPEDDEEKRLKRFRPKAPQSYLTKLYRAQTQR